VAGANISWRMLRISGRKNKQPKIAAIRITEHFQLSAKRFHFVMMTPSFFF
jgi:hypothetical protein